MLTDTVFAPIYPLAPNHTYKETYEIVEKLYNRLLTTGKPIIIMGDSAGGGLTAAFCEYLAVKDMPQPKNIILISPWVDISMSGDYDEVEYEYFLGFESDEETTIFIGTHEIIYPDIVKFYNKLQDNGVDAELIVGEEMSHVYPLYPMVPEAKEAFNRIAEILLD